MTTYLSEQLRQKCKGSCLAVRSQEEENRGHGRLHRVTGIGKWDWTDLKIFFGQTGVGVSE